MRIFLLLVLLFNILKPADLSAGPLVISIVSPYNGLNLLQKKYWLKLLHYYNGQSRADGENFFLSSVGKYNPEAELNATIAAFKDSNAKSGWFNYHPQCVFRERLNFLKNAGLLNGLVEKSCQAFDDWKKGLNADSITLVFSSSYPNNPSSLFGHTLIRLNQKNKTNDLLDYAIAFSAMPEKEDIGVVFAFKGMFGGYKGLLEVTKYYTKVNEYNNGESRDLIEYDIKMTVDELDRLINHLWEIYQTTYFDYYFTDENCSAVLADILAVPFPLDSINDHKRWYYLPSEMIKTFKQIPKRVNKENFRPSLKKQLENKLLRLTPTELKEVQVLSKSSSLPPSYNDIRVLDGVINLMDFTRYRTKNQLSENEKIIFRSALLRRSQNAQENEPVHYSYSQNNRPDKGHEPQKISFFIRIENQDTLLGLELKQGYHDLMSNDQGYDPFSQFDFFTGTLIYDKKLNKVDYDQLTFVSLISLHPYKFYDPQFSWSVKVVADRIYDLDCKLCHKINARAYLGPTLKPNDQMALSILSGIFGEASKNLDKGYRLGIGLEGSSLFQLTENSKLAFFDELRFNLIGKFQKDYYNTIGFKQSYFSSINTEWRFESSLVSTFKSFKINTKIFQLNYGIYF